MQIESSFQMGKRMTKKKTKTKPASRKRAEAPKPAIEQRDWSLPTLLSIALDKARLAHWWAVMNGGDTGKTLKAWAELLHVPRTRRTSK